MLSEPPAIARQILETLLDRVEQPRRLQVVRVRFSIERHPEYFSNLDVTMRQQTNVFLKQLAEQGIVRLHWRKWEEGNWLDAVDLANDRSNVLYTLLRRTPRKNQQTLLRELLAAQTPQVKWHADFLAWAETQLNTHASVSPLELNNPEWNRDLLCALEAIGGLRVSTLERTLSVQLFSRSKRLKELREAIVTVLRRHDREASNYGEENWALLQAHYLDRVPEYLPIAGPLTLQSKGCSIDLAAFAPSVALSAAMLREATVIGYPASSIVTVENATSFNELLAVKPPQTVAIFIGGFASPTALSLLKQIAATRRSIPFFHWGDLDAGGLRILAHLRQHFGGQPESIARLGMDEDTFDTHLAHAQPLTGNDRAALQKLLVLPVLSDCVPLIGRLLATSLKLEQEAVSATTFSQLL